MDPNDYKATQAHMKYSKIGNQEEETRKYTLWNTGKMNQKTTREVVYMQKGNWERMTMGVRLSKATFH